MKLVNKIFNKVKKKIKQKKCEHEWKLFDSGYKQCKKCLKIDIND